MKNHRSDFETPFGSIVLLPSGEAVLANCKFCSFSKETEQNSRKHWSAASRARMGLQLHVIAAHKTEPEVAGYIR